MRQRLVAGFLAVLVLVLPSPAAATTAMLSPGTRFYVANPNPGATQQIAALKAAGKTRTANRLKQMVNTPAGVWFTAGTPAEVKAYAEEVVAEAADQGTVPVLVAYNVPGRDCGLYSEGGAANGAAYHAWIDKLVEGIGQTKVVVIIEPDGLSLLPSDCGQPDTYDRVALISYAAHRFLDNANALVYIDAGNSNWNSVNLTAERLVEVGVDDVAGFALNVSNFQFTKNSIVYGTWVSKCIAFATLVDPGNYEECPDQYGSYGGVPLSSYGRWSDGASKARFNTSTENNRYDALLGATNPSTHFVVDTSRNGRGPWKGTNAHPASDEDTEAWCNPLGRGAGMRPTADTAKTLVDAYLWIKLPGESDGLCYRWTDGPKDPARHMKDPAAGAWFRQQALELMKLAVPAFR
jgi:endoglucanase